MARKPESASNPPPAPASAGEAMAWWVDAWQRSVLFWDVLRQRGNAYLEHEKRGKPPVLAFDYTPVVDGRTLERPVNYSLVRIEPRDTTPPDPAKRPVVVLDPRAGHGPGIGGSKPDSEIGIALRHGHPCYFITFAPEPVPGQTIADIVAAESEFLREVGRRHPDADGKPIVIGNCQGGWALMLLSATAPELVGPVLIAGSPLSYWAGTRGKHPMRYAGGLLGGSWLASFTADLGHGRFDGAHLVENFEALNPANTLWGKLDRLYANVDTEAPRFLEFERWWGGFFLMNRAEIDWIVQNLFVGNKLARGEARLTPDSAPLDLKRIRSPIVVFASWGDNITPPPQALNWILDLYDDVAEIRLYEQTIVYCLHPDAGHLGIFVSAKVANRETSELVSTLDMIDLLPPGLYEAIVDEAGEKDHRRELIEGEHLIRFEPRRFDDLRALDDGRDDEADFEVVQRVAEINQSVYDRFMSPWVRLWTSEPFATALRAWSPSRLQRYALSDLNPAMWSLSSLAAQVRRNRAPVAADNALHRAERAASERIEAGLDRYREWRDAFQERLFRAIYGAPWLRATLGLPEQPAARQHRDHAPLRLLKLRELEDAVAAGGWLEAWARIAVHTGRGGPVDERPYRLLKRMIAELPRAQRPSMAAVKNALRHQFMILLHDEQGALAALPKLLPDPATRRRVLDAVRALWEASGPLSEERRARLAQVEQVLGLGPRPRRQRTTARPAPRATSARRAAPARKRR